MVWIESITTSAASLRRSRLAAMSRRLIAAASSQRRVRERRGGGRAAAPARSIPRPRRRARAGPRARVGAAACSSRVDLPMPGSPPTSTAEAGTRPPPSTRSSSAMPVAARGGGSALPARPTKRDARPAALCAAGPGRAATASSTMVFHSPQVSQRPAHFGVTAPQDWQTKRLCCLAIGDPPARSRRLPTVRRHQIAMKVFSFARTSCAICGGTAALA